MKKTAFLFFLILTISSAKAQTAKDLLAGQHTTETMQKMLDSAMRPHFYISTEEAEKIIGRKAVLKDSAFKYANGMLRFSFNYIAKRVDSTAKGRIFFSFEQYKDENTATVTYQSIRSENERSGALEIIKDLGDEAFLQKDVLGQPFIIVREGAKIFKIRVYDVSTEKSRKELMKVAEKILKKY